MHVPCCLHLDLLGPLFTTQGGGGPERKSRGKNTAGRKHSTDFQAVANTGHTGLWVCDMRQEDGRVSSLVSSGHSSEAVLRSPPGEILVTGLWAMRSYQSWHSISWFGVEALSWVELPTTSLCGYKAEPLRQISNSRIALALSTWPTG